MSTPLTSSLFFKCFLSNMGPISVPSERKEVLGHQDLQVQLKYVICRGIMLP